jgi:hypothetical protein
MLRTPDRESPIVKSGGWVDNDSEGMMGYEYVVAETTAPRGALSGEGYAV